MKKLLSAVLVSALALGFSLSAASCSESKAYSSDLASLQQQITELQDKNQELKEQIDSISSQNDALKLQIEKLISSDEIPSYTLDDDIPGYIDGIKVFEMKHLFTGDSNSIFGCENVKTDLYKTYIQNGLSAFRYEHSTQKVSISTTIHIASFPSVSISFSDYASGTQTIILYFFNRPFASVTFE